MAAKKANSELDLEVSVHAFPQGAGRRAGRAWSSWLLLIGGVVLTAVGILGALGSEFVPDLQSTLANGAAVGIGNGDLLVGGVLLLALALVAGSQRAHTQRILEDEETEQAIAELGSDMAEFSNRMTEFQGDHLHFRTELGGVRSDLRDWREKQENNRDANDALYRLAASLDQLGARLDKRIGEAVGSVVEQVDEVTHLVEASRDFLQESLEESAAGMPALARDVQGLTDELQSLQDCVRGLGEAGYRVPASEPDGTPAPVFDQEEDDLGDFVISVDLDDEQDPALAMPGLGLLDEIEDEEEYEYEEQGLANELEIDELSALDEPASEAPSPLLPSDEPATPETTPVPETPPSAPVPPTPLTLVESTPDAQPPAPLPHATDDAPATPSPIPSTTESETPPPLEPPAESTATTGADGLTEVHLDGPAPPRGPSPSGLQMPEPPDSPLPGNSPPWAEGF